MPVELLLFLVVSVVLLVLLELLEEVEDLDEELPELLELVPELLVEELSDTVKIASAVPSSHTMVSVCSPVERVSR